MLTDKLRIELNKMDQMAAPLFAQIAQALFVMLPQLMEVAKADLDENFAEQDDVFLTWLDSTSRENNLVYLGLVGLIIAVALPERQDENVG